MQRKIIWQREPKGHDEHKDEVVGEGGRMFQTGGRHLSFAAAGSGKTGPEEDPLHRLLVLVTSGAAAVE